MSSAPSFARLRSALTPPSPSALRPRLRALPPLTRSDSADSAAPLMGVGGGGGGFSGAAAADGDAQPAQEFVAAAAAAAAAHPLQAPPSPRRERAVALSPLSSALWSAAASPAVFLGDEADLSALEGMRTVLVKQVVELVEIATGVETSNRYKVFVKEFGRAPVLLAREHSSFWSRTCLGARRPFVVHVFHPNHMGDLLTLTRSSCCLGASVMSVRLGGSERLLGAVRSKLSLRSRLLHITEGSARAPLFEIRAAFCDPWVFRVVRVSRGQSEDSVGGEVAVIEKRWSGMQEFMGDADNFSLDFVGALSVAEKALVLSAVFLIDYLYFENNDRGYTR